MMMMKAFHSAAAPMKGVMPAMGAMIAPEMPAMADPITSVISPIRVTLTPCSSAPRGFCATARIDRPSPLRISSSHSRTDRTLIATMTKTRDQGSSASPSLITPGSGETSVCPTGPKSCTTSACSM